MLYVFSTLLQDPHLRWYAAASQATIGADLLTLAAYDPRLKARSPLELPQSRCFPSVGLASFHAALGDKENDISFLLRSSPYGGVSHGHADQNAFVVEAFGRGLAIATGYYPWYGSPHHVEWTRATHAVNSVLVDGEGQVPRRWDANGRLTAFESSGGYDYAEGEAAPAYQGRLKRFRRHVVHARPGVFVICDDLEAPRAVRLQWLLHAYRKIAVDEPARTLRIENAPAAMRVHLLLPETLNFSQTDRYQPEPESQAGRWENTWHLTAETSTAAKRGRYLAVLLAHRKGREDALPEVELVEGDGAVGVRLTAPDGAGDLVAFRTSGEKETLACGEEDFNGRVFAVGKDQRGREVRRLEVPRE